MSRPNKNIRAFFFCFVMTLTFILPMDGVAQVPEVRKVEVMGSEDEVPIRMMIPVCETEQRLREKYSNYSTKDQVAELIKEDSSFTCTGVRGTTRYSGKRFVVRGILEQKRDEAFPELIKVVKKGKAENSALALDIIQHADDKLLSEYRDLFLKKSESKHTAERNRSLYILKRIRDEHIEKVIVKRWNELSKREVEEFSQNYTLRLIFELMIYGAKDRELLEESILFTLREKKLSPEALTEFFRVLNSFVIHDHNTEIDQEVANIFGRTNNETVSDHAAQVLSESRSVEARNALIHGLELKDETKRAQATHHLISRYDFKIDEDTLLLKRIFSDDSRKVIDYAYSPLTWKKPDAAQSAILVQCLLNELNQPKNPVAFKAYLMMHFYANLNELWRDSLKMEDPSSVLNAIETVLSSPELERASFTLTQHLHEQIYGENEMEITHLEFWEKMLKK